MSEYQEPQLPNLGIETVVNNQNILELSEGVLPWIDGEARVHTAEVILETGEQIRYGSAVGLNGKVQKIADKVPEVQSTSAEAGLFKALPELLSGTALPKNIDHVSDFVVTSADSPTIYKVAKYGKGGARLYFGVYNVPKSKPIVLKLGIAMHDKQIALQNVMNGKTGGRRK